MASNQYVAQLTPQAVADVCPLPAQNYSKEELRNLYPNGVVSDRLTPDPSTGRIPAGQVQEYVNNLYNNGTLPRRPKVKVGNTYETDMNSLVPQDGQLFQKLRDEYCYYEQRYRYALKEFLKLATSRDASQNAEAQQFLQITKTLNSRTNTMLELMNYLAQSRVDDINENKTTIDNVNKIVNNKLAKLGASYKMLTRDNVIVNTQKASVEYTEEKNNYTTNQISIWAALNVIALATIFYVYRA